ncbi:MAG: serine/threonine protein kinase [Cyanobacteria bacterium HKST-UBA02]|nr:serine/threonine protein kinase [Cyanobacteria bacterium HKST-UBA02]
MENEPELSDDSPGPEVEADEFPVDRYEPLRVLGEGAAATVYLCRDLLLDKKVAVKTLHSLTPEKLIAFQREARTTSMLKHPNVIAVLDFGATKAGNPYLVMDAYQKEVPLDKFEAESGRLDESLFLLIFRQVCSALQYAHEKGIFHRDIKPSNILIGADHPGDFGVHVIDFGIAAIKQDLVEPVEYQGRTLVGTPAFMSPDQANGLAFDARSEIYCLGCTMFRMLTGHLVFDGDSAIEVMRRHVQEIPPTVADLRPDLPDFIAMTVDRCLAKDPDSRFQSMREVEEALNRGHSDDEFESEPPVPFALLPGDPLDLPVVDQQQRVVLLVFVAFFLQWIPWLLTDLISMTAINNATPIWYITLNIGLQVAALRLWIIACDIQARAKHYTRWLSVLGLLGLTGYLVVRFLPSRKESVASAGADMVSNYTDDAVKEGGPKGLRCSASRLAVAVAGAAFACTALPVSVAFIVMLGWPYGEPVQLAEWVDGFLSPARLALWQIACGLVAFSKGYSPLLFFFGQYDFIGYLIVWFSPQATRTLLKERSNARAGVAEPETVEMPMTLADARRCQAEQMAIVLALLAFSLELLPSTLPWLGLGPIVFPWPIQVLFDMAVWIMACGLIAYSRGIGLWWSIAGILFQFGFGLIFLFARRPFRRNRMDES